MTRFAYAERLAFVDQMALAGPDAPTLCTGWSVRDLAAHVYLREHRPDAAMGILARPFAAHTERVQQRIAQAGFEELLEKLRHVPWWARPLDEQMNLAEMFVHHEDVRRARAGWRARELPEAYQRALFRQLRWRKLRQFRGVLHIEAPGFGALRAGKGGDDVVRLSGPPGELLLFLFGRQSHADVTLEGPPTAVDYLRTGNLGM